METDKVQIVLFSGGLSSYEVSRRVIGHYGKTNVQLWYFDTLIEDEDVYRFIRESQEILGVEVKFFKDGRNPWQVFKDERFIGNSRVPLCNRVLKRELLERTLRLFHPKKNVVLHFGYDFYETNRMNKAKSRWTEYGYEICFPLVQPPFLEKSALIKKVELEGIKAPKLYLNGFLHNNCGGACVQAGIKQWSKLWFEFPDRFLWHEEQELHLREFLNKDVSILRDRKNKSTKPLTLQELRTRLDISRERKFVHEQ